MKRIAFIAGTLVAIGLVAAWITFRDRVTTPPQSGGSVSIQNVSNEAFGALDPAKRVTTDVSGRSELSASDAPTASSSGGSTAGSSGSGTGTIVPAPTDIVTYEFAYTGDPLTIPALSVLKRTKGFDGSGLAKFVQENFGFVPLSIFANLKTDTLTVSQSSDDGYSISIDFNEGSVWMNRMSGSTGIKPLPAVLNDTSVPVTNASPANDAELIAITNAFLAAHGISRDAYGAPVVQNNSVTPLGVESLARPPIYYYPIDGTVVYPLVVNGQQVYDEGGNVFGLTLTVSSADKVVTSVSNLMSLNFQASAYDLEADPDAILAVVKRGGLYGTGTFPGATRTVRIEVGTPTSGYMLSRYQFTDTPEDLLVPALIFPITKVPEGQTYYATTIIVPLVKDLLTPPTVTVSPTEPAPDAEPLPLKGESSGMNPSY